MNTEIENNLINSFVIKEKRARARLELFDPIRREKFLSQLGKYLDGKTFISVKTGDMKNVYAILKDAGATDLCYIISTNPQKDGREFSLSEGLKILDYEFELMSCISGKLAFFRETPTKGYILKTR